MNAAMKSTKSEVTDLTDEITNFQYQLQQTQKELTAQYSTMNTTLEQLPQMLAQINDQLNALNPRSNT
jgi:flagellar capping protein FliD